MLGRFQKSVERIQNGEYPVLLRALWILIFLGLFVAGVSALVTRFIKIDGAPLVDLIHQYRTWSISLYFVYIVVATIIVPLPTLPGDVIMLESFNPWKVLAVRLVADMVGGVIAFYIARVFGRNLLKRLFSPRTYQQIEKASHHVTWKQFFWVTMFPLINTEVMAYAGGLSELSLFSTISSLCVGVSYRLLIVYFFVYH